MTNWIQSGNPKVKLTNSAEFLQASDVSENCKNSYQNYITHADPTKFVKERGFYKTDWSYIDNQSKSKYLATWSEQYKFGVMKLPMPEPEPGDEELEEEVEQEIGGQTRAGGHGQEGQQTLHVQAITKGDNESLGRIADEITIIRKLIEIIAEKKASDLITPASDVK